MFMMEERKIRPGQEKLPRQGKKRIVVANDRMNRIEARRRQRAREKNRSSLITILASASAVMALLVVMNYTKIDSLHTTIGDIEAETRLRESEREVLEAELEPYKSTARIEELAKVNLGMDYPRPDQIVKINMDTGVKAADLDLPEKKGIVATILSAIGIED